VGNESKETQPIHEEVRNLIADVRAATTESLVLLVYHRDGVEALPLEADPIVVGREEPSDCVIDDATLSRQHARFTRMGAVVEVEDLGSRNGTFVAGKSVSKIELRVGAECMLGGVVVALHARGGGGIGEKEKRSDRTRRSSAASAEAFVESGAMREILGQLERVANSTIPVLLQGETGTGKEVLARALHDRGRRRRGRMVCLNCAAIPAHLVETTLFGNERGAFTGADSSRRGAFEDAHEGTLLLDEIGELSASAQAALLRVIETNKVMRVGSTREIPVDVRIVAATHRDLESMVQQNLFRADLLYRLNGISLLIPPLRARREEIRPLARHFFRRANTAHGRDLRRIDERALRLLESYAWPGNVRELRNAIERAVVIAHGEEVRAEDLPDRVQTTLVAAVTAEPAPGALNAKDIKARMLGLEGRMIEEALRACGGNQTEAAKRLEMPLRTLVRKVKALGLGLKPRGEE